VTGPEAVAGPSAAVRPSRILAILAFAVDSAEADHRRTRRYALRTPVPLETEYRTAEVREGALELHPDVYGRERTTLRSRALAALRGAGFPEFWVDTAQIDSAMRAGRRGHVRWSSTG
jgi:hypothetical protein